MIRMPLCFLLTALLGAAEPPAPPVPPMAPNPFQAAPGEPQRDRREVHLAGLRQLTHEGSNAEAYGSFDGRRSVFEADWVD